MSKLVRFAAVFVVLASMGVFATDDSSAGCTLYCDADFSWTNGQWGVEPTCEQAYNAAVNAARNEAYRICASYGLFVCEFGALAVPTPCMDKDGMKRVDVAIEYKCGYEQCDPDDPEEPLPPLD